MELKDFLVKAKLATYASQKPTKMNLIDGGKQLTLEHDEFRYKDKYYGFNPFSGQEVVWKRDVCIWSMNYYGEITDKKVDPKEIYEFLKTALRHISSDRPFRGPLQHSQGDFCYIDVSHGDINKFIGREKIYLYEKEIYQLTYHGGKIKSKG
jgi:hypothetical protein